MSALVPNPRSLLEHQSKTAQIATRYELSSNRFWVLLQITSSRYKSAVKRQCLMSNLTHYLSSCVSEEVSIYIKFAAHIKPDWITLYNKLSFLRRFLATDQWFETQLYKQSDGLTGLDITSDDHSQDRSYPCDSRLLISEFPLLGVFETLRSRL